MCEGEIEDPINFSTQIWKSLITCNEDFPEVISASCDTQQSPLEDRLQNIILN